MRKEDYEFHAEFCKTFSHPARLQILDLLKEGEMSVCAIRMHLGTSEANASRHVKLMRMWKLVHTRRDGHNVYCSITNKKLAEACSRMRDVLVQIMESAPLPSN